MEMRNHIGSNRARIWCDAKLPLDASYGSDDTAKVDASYGSNDTAKVADGNVFFDGSI